MTTPVAPPSSILGQGLPVVLLHAFALDGRMWTAQAEALSDRFQIIVPDLRGFGAASGQLDGLEEIAIDLVADDIAVLLDELKVESAVIGGISRGGYIALSFARRYPQRLKGLILLDTRAAPADEKEKQTSDGMVERLQSEGVGFVPEAMKNRFWGSTTLASRPALIETTSLIVLSQDPRAISAASRGMASRPDARPGLQSIRVPTLAIAGVEDPMSAPTREIAEAVPGGRFVEIPEAGHLSNLERPEQVTAEMRRFLESVAVQRA